MPNKYDIILGAYREDDAGTGSDKNFTQDFLTTDEVTVTHNLDKFVSVTVIDSAGDEVIGEVNYVSNNVIVVSFTSAFSGKITCN